MRIQPSVRAQKVVGAKNLLEKCTPGGNSGCGKNSSVFYSQLVAFLVPSSFFPPFVTRSENNPKNNVICGSMRKNAFEIRRSPPIQPKLVPILHI